MELMRSLLIFNRRTCQVFIRRSLHTPYKSILKESVFLSYMSHVLDSSHQAEVSRNDLSRWKNIERKYREIQEYQNDIKDLESLDEGVKATGDNDGEMLELIRQDQQSYEMALEQKESELLYLLLPSVSTGNNDVIVDVSAGAGGQEAMLFTADMFNMYHSYINYKGWRQTVVQKDRSDIGGLRHARLEVSGADAYSHLRHEAGVHRVQRVPRTDRGGRVHTSTMAVTVMAKPTEIQIVIDNKHLRVDTFRASGPGGQSVNKSDSAVRLTHLPTGVVVECQIERSQVTNHKLALEALRLKLFQQQLDKQDEFLYFSRKTQVGSMERAEKIRTYNYNQDRVTDHRVGVSVRNLPDFLTGGEALDALIRHVHTVTQREAVLTMCAEYIRDGKENGKMTSNHKQT